MSSSKGDFHLGVFVAKPGSLSTKCPDHYGTWQVVQHLMAPLGRAALLLSFGLAAYALIAGSYAAWKRRRRLALSAQNALLAAFPTTLIAAIILLVALGRRDMTFVYVWQHTSHKLPPRLRAVRLLGRPGGFAPALAARAYRLCGTRGWLNRRSRDLIAWTVPVFGLVAVFFAFMLCFVSSPFNVQPAPRTAGGWCRACRTRTCSPIRRCSISATSDSRSRSPSRWARSSRAGRTSAGSSRRAAGRSPPGRFSASGS